MLKDQSFRLYGIDAPEISLRGDTTPEEKQRGLELKAWLAERLEGQDVVLHTYKNDKGKYGRWLCEVVHEDINLNQFMLDQNWVEPY